MVDRTGAGDCYAAGFLTILMESVKNKAELDDLMKDRQEEFKSILKSCGEFATHSAIYKITKQKPPERKELDAFMDSFKIK